MNLSPEEALFALSLEKPTDKRPAFLDAVCEGDAALRQRLEALLAAHEQPDTAPAAVTVEARPTINLDLADAPDEAVGQTLGRYKLLERIGEGGCGVVCVAEQTEPVRRRVALKVIKLGMDTKQVVALFLQGEASMTPLPASTTNPFRDGEHQNDVISWLAYREAVTLLPLPDDETLRERRAENRRRLLEEVPAVDTAP